MVLQLQVEPILKGHHGAKYYGMLQACLVIYKEEGARAFWKGHIPAQVLSVIFGVVQVSGKIVWHDKLLILGIQRSPCNTR